MCELIKNLVAKHRDQDKREARAEGLALGLTQGRAEGKIEMALKLLRNGFDVRAIEKASGIPLKTIQAEALRLGLDAPL